MISNLSTVPNNNSKAIKLDTTATRQIVLLSVLLLGRRAWTHNNVASACKKEGSHGIANPIGIH